jgi:Asp/Glu/hydantoin racemase
MKPLRLALLNPNTNTATTETMAAIAREAASEGVSVAAVTVREGAPLITNPAAMAEAAHAVAAMAGELHCYDGVIVSAFGDPGRAALAHLLPCPVVGIAEASMIEATEISNGRFSVVSTTPDLCGSMQETARHYGVDAALASVRVTRGDPATLMADEHRLDSALEALIRQAIDQDQARAVVIGGGPLALAARRLRAGCAVPLIEPIPAAVRRMLTVLQTT